MRILLFFAIPFNFVGQRIYFCLFLKRVRIADFFFMLSLLTCEVAKYDYLPSIIDFLFRNYQATFVFCGFTSLNCGLPIV